jgi:hypothetical protein
MQKSPPTGESELKKHFPPLLPLALLIASAVAAPAQTEQVTAFTGTWTFNAAKSKFNPGSPFQSFTLTFAPDGTRHLDLIGANGQPLKASLPWSDGKEVSVIVTQGAMENVTAISKIKGKTFVDTWRESGKVIEKVRGFVSADGKTLTVRVEGPLPQGGTFRNQVVFDKQ